MEQDAVWHMPVLDTESQGLTQSGDSTGDP